MINSHKIKLYFDKSLLLEGISHNFLLLPFLGNYSSLRSDPDNGRFDEYIENGHLFFDISSNPQDCDFFLLPFGFSFEEKYQKNINTCMALAKKYQKKVILFYNADDASDIKIKNAIIFRTSLYKSTQEFNTFALPGWSLDFIKYFKNNTYSTIDYSKVPTISYCGYVDYSKKSISTVINLFKKKDLEQYSKLIRGKACRGLLNNNHIKCNFIFRDGFWAAGIEDKSIARKEYADNIISSLYSIATRGAGNFSYRLYEILSCGRIPIFINTDAVLPFDSIVDWKKHVVWIEENELSKIDEIVLKFHQSKTPKQLFDIQESNRNLYVNYLSPMGFFSKLHLELHKLK